MTETTRVLFRVTKRGEFKGDVTAVFPDIDAVRGTCACYAHVGQHSSCDTAWALETTRRAKPHEYADLKAELEAEPYGYKLEVIERL